MNCWSRLPDWVRAAVTVACLSLAWTLSPARQITRSILGVAYDAYPALLFTGLMVLALWGARRRQHASLWRVAVVGALWGEFIAFAAIVLSTLLSPDGASRVIHGVEKMGGGLVGVAKSAAMDAAVAAMLGGWLMGAVVLAILHASPSRRIDDAR